MTSTDTSSKRPSQVEHAYQEIKARIVYGLYKPGTDLSEATLARVLKMSRTPVREALSRLSEERHVIRSPGRGFVVAPVTISMVRDTYQLRRLLEAEGAGLAAELATPDDVENLSDLADYHYLVGDPASYREALKRNLDFHLAVARASRNDLLVEFVRRCLVQTDRVLSLGADFGPFEKGSSAEHRKIVSRIRARDAAGARRAMRGHLERASRLMMDNLLRGAIRGAVV
jgi:DNA-binding GntR family transcriptional regulator